jgi:tetratricopeptide (TPR) repeat protein
MQDQNPEERIRHLIHDVSKGNIAALDEIQLAKMITDSKTITAEDQHLQNPFGDFFQQLSFSNPSPVILIWPEVSGPMVCDLVEKGTVQFCVKNDINDIPIESVNLFHTRGIADRIKIVTLNDISQTSGTWDVIVMTGSEMISVGIENLLNSIDFKWLIVSDGLQASDPQQGSQLKHALSAYGFEVGSNHIEAYQWKNRILWGEHLISKGQFSEAADFLKKMLEADPTNLDVINDLGVIAYQLGQLDAAEDFFRMAITLDSKNLYALSNLAQVQLVTHRYEEALHTLNAIVELDKDNPEWQSMIETCRQNLNRNSIPTDISTNPAPLDSTAPITVNEDLNPVRLTVNIITYKLPQDMLKSAIESVCHTTPEEYVTIRIINNGPPLDASFYPAGIEIIENGPDTKHLSKTWNDAIRTSPDEWVLISNDDVEFQTGWFNVWNQCVSEGYELIGRGFSIFSIKKSAWEKLVGFDENFKFGYCEDADFLIRCVKNNVKMSQEFGPIDFDCKLYGYFIHFHRDRPEKYAKLKRGYRPNERKCNLDYFSQKYGKGYQSLPELLLGVIPNYKHQWRFKNVTALFSKDKGSPPVESNSLDPSQKITSSLEQMYAQKCKTPSDINLHLPTLKKYAEKCSHVTEFGVRWVVSTWALLAGKPQKLICYDINYHPNIEKAKEIAAENNIHFTFNANNVLDIEIEETELLFIDTYHTYHQLKKELELHACNAKRYIILHDTIIYGRRSADGFNKGLLDAIEAYLRENSNWKIIEQSNDNIGLTVMERINP